MTAASRPSWIDRIVRFAPRIAGSALVTLAVLILAGWWLHWRQVVQPLPDGAPTAPSTALAMLVAGTALLVTGHGQRRLQRVGGAILILLVGAVTFLPTDSLAPFGEWLNAPGLPRATMAPATGMAFLLTGLALIFTHQRRALRWAAAALTLIVAGIGLGGLAGYLLHADFLLAWMPYVQMSVQTALAAVVLGVGLLANLRNSQSSNTTPGSDEDEQPILLTGAAILVIMALLSGFASFLILERQTTVSLQRALTLTLTNRVETYQSILDQGVSNSVIVATRPVIQRALNTLAQTPADATARQAISTAVHSFLGTGYRFIRIQDTRGRVIAEAGQATTQPAQRVPLTLPYPSELLWDHGMVLRVTASIFEGRRTIGTLSTEQALPRLTQLFDDIRSIGETGEMAVCARVADNLVCFPTRLAAKGIVTPTVQNGKALPMTHALAGETGLIHTRDYRRQQVIAAYAPIGTTGLGMVVKVDAAELYQPVYRQLQTLLAILAVMVISGVWLLRWRVRPLVQRLTESKVVLSTAEQRLRSVITNSLHGLIIIDRNSRILSVNPAAERIFGYPAAELVGQSLAMLLPPSLRPEGEQVLRHLHQQSINQTREWEAARKNGEVFPFELALFGIAGSHGERHFACMVTDISARKWAESRLRDSEQQFRALAVHAPVGIFLTNVAGECEYVNPAWCRLAGLTPEAAAGNGWMQALHPDDRDRVLEVWRVAAMAGQEFRAEYRFRTPAGQVTWLTGNAVPLRDADGGIRSYIGTIADITLRKQAEEQAQAMSHTDELTGLHNRRGFLALAEQQMRLARRHQTPLHLAYVDMDGMKAINDRFGHAGGDRALQDVAAVLRATFRDSDVVARIGGDEFAALAVGADDAAMTTILNRLTDAIATTNREGRQPYALSVSVGAVPCRCTAENPTTLEDLLKQADERMYHAKGTKRRRSGA